MVPLCFSVAKQGLESADSDPAAPSHQLTMEERAGPGGGVYRRGPPPPHTHIRQVEGELDHSRAEKDWRPLCPKP